MLGQFLFK